VVDFRSPLDVAAAANRENNKMYRLIKDAIYIRKEEDQTMNRDEESYQLSHVYEKLFTAPATSNGELKSTSSF